MEGEKITAIGQDLSVATDQVVDASGLYVLPGGVDQHVHFSFTYKCSSVASWWWMEANTSEKKDREDLLQENPLDSATRGYNESD